MKTIEKDENIDKTDGSHWATMKCYEIHWKNVEILWEPLEKMWKLEKTFEIHGKPLKNESNRMKTIEKQMKNIETQWKLLKSIGNSIKTIKKDENGSKIIGIIMTWIWHDFGIMLGSFWDSLELTASQPASQPAGATG